MNADGWTQLGEHTYARRYAPYDVTVGVVLGTHSALVIDTRASLNEGRRVREDVTELSDLPIRYVVNTHQHFDHTLGNAAFDESTLIGHESLLTSLPAYLDGVRAGRADATPTPELRESPTRVPDLTFSSAWATDLGDCLVELVHPGPGHTAGDVVVKVAPDRVLFAGDAVEQAGPPSWGEDSYPLEWGTALDLVMGLAELNATIVPGHGDPVDRDFVLEQRQLVLDVADQIHACADRGESVEEALRREWPLEPERLGAAVRRGFEHLGRSAV